MFLLFHQRKWKNDVHMAVRDCRRARTLNSSSYKALLLMSEALLQVMTCTIREFIYHF